MTGETGSCFGRNVFLLRVVPEPDSGRYAVARGGTARDLLYLASFREVFKDLWTASISWRELREVLTSALLVGSEPTPAIVQLLIWRPHSRCPIPFTATPILKQRLIGLTDIFRKDMLRFARTSRTHRV
jgi:hypothetical protein